MSLLAALCPQPPDWTVNWDAALTALPWLRPLHDCPQDPRHHAEGDVGTHTRLALEALAALPVWRRLPEDERVQVHTAVLLHDIGKPACTRTEPDGRISANGHSRQGERLARRHLRELGVPPAWREHVAMLIRHHQLPFWVLERDDPARAVHTVAQTTRCDHLLLLGLADATGRVCADQQALLERVELFGAYCDELGRTGTPYPFTSDHARFAYFRTPGRDPAWPAHDDTRTSILLLSGLPASGKDHWLTHHGPDQPVVSLDAIRTELGIPPDRPQGAVIDTAHQRAREYLRRRQPFTWNATNLTRQLRGRLVDLAHAHAHAHAHQARVHVVALEVDPATQRARNRARPRPVPAQAVERMLHLWEPPDLTEAHTLRHVDTGDTVTGDTVGTGRA